MLCVLVKFKMVDETRMPFEVMAQGLENSLGALVSWSG